MKRVVFFASVLLICSLQIFAQHPLVGTWQLISMKGIDRDGKNFSVNNSSVKEIKIITPTHYIEMEHVVKGDSVIFKHCQTGTARVEGSKLIETSFPGLSSLGYDGVKTDLSWRIVGDKCIQSGTIEFPDGAKTIIESMVFQRVKAAPASIQNNPLVGTWSQLSSEFILPDGTKGSYTNTTHSRLYILTPTHWVTIDHDGKNFENSVGGTYQLKGNKLIPTATVASYPLAEEFKYDITERFEGDRLYVHGTRVGSDGKKLIWDDVFQRVTN
jgi:hypothetical protein